MIHKNASCCPCLMPRFLVSYFTSWRHFAYLGTLSNCWLLSKALYLIHDSLMLWLLYLTGTSISPVMLLLGNVAELKERGHMSPLSEVATSEVRPIVEKRITLSFARQLFQDLGNLENSESMGKADVGYRSTDCVRCFRKISIPPPPPFICMSYLLSTLAVLRHNRRAKSYIP